MSFRLVHAAGNMFARTSSRVAAYSKAAAAADVVTYSEASKDHAAIRKIPGKDFTLYDELAIGWDRTKFTPAGKPVARLVMVGGKRGAGGSDKRRRGPNRYGLVIPLRETSTGQQWLIATHHAIAKADTSQKWRRDLRAQGFRNFGALVRDMQKAYPKAQLIVTGDWNTIGAVNLGVGLTEVKTPASFGRLRYDRTQHSSDVRVTGITTFATGLDHKALAANVSAMGALPTPLPTPPEVPVARQARSLDVMLAEVNKHAPNRSKASDGGLGDQAHSARVSDHNPNSAGVWRARDVTNDAKGGMDGYTLSRLVAAKLGKHPALGSGAYVIFNRQIISTSRLSEGWRYYGGTNAHQHHVHISVATSASGYDSTKAWDLFAPVAPPKPTAETPYDHLYDEVEAALAKYGPSIESKYKARRAFVAALTVALRAAPVPAYRKAK